MTAERRPLNTIGMPYYREVLLSAWPDIICDVGAPPPKLDPQWLSTLTKYDAGFYGKPREGLRRNQVENTRTLEKSSRTGLQAPKFLSEKARESKLSSTKDDGVSEALAQLGLRGSESEVPVMYRAVEIKYSKFGVDDFDFGYVACHIHTHTHTSVS